MQHHEDTQIAPYAHPRAQLTPQNQPKTASKIENTHPNAAILTRKHTLPHFMQRALVRQNMACLQPVEEDLYLRDVITLTSRQDEADGIAQRVGGSVNLGAQATF